MKSWFLDCRPVRRLHWEEAEGAVIVFRPRFGESRWGRALASRLGWSDYRIRLDEIGSRIWVLCDGSATAAAIAAQLRRDFGDRVEPAEERLQTFVFQMNRARMVNLETGGTPPP